MRAITNTFIQTPVRGRKPCFLIRGLREDVTSAINKIADMSNEYTEALQKCTRPGGVRLCVPVERGSVALLIGSKGHVIKNIQEQTNTFIRTPVRCKQMGAVAAFDVRGNIRNVFRARDLMYRYIFDRTKINLEKVNSQIYGIKAALNGLEMYKEVEHPVATHLPVLDVHAHHRSGPFAHVHSPDISSPHSSANSSVESSPTIGLGNWVRRSMCSACGRGECVNVSLKCGHATLCSQCCKKFLCAETTCPGYYGRITN